MKLLLITLAFLANACSAVGIVSSSDPQDKIRQAYYLMDEGRHFPAKRILGEAMQIAKERNDKILEASILTTYGDLYKSPPHATMSQNLRDYKLSANYYLEAATILEGLNLKKRQSMAHLGAAMAYHADKQQKEACKQLDLSLKSYNTKSDDTFVVHQSWDNSKASFAQNIATTKKEYKCK